jgi:hypothetical protein
LYRLERAEPLALSPATPERAEEAAGVLDDRAPTGVTTL